ncbi:MAG TPA: DNA mismatch repair protein MutS, partial [Ktedonobacterales bacterium]|nr:DNA mismatch repair protein MutS [Ktedonobacterales bacterium]
MSTPARQQYLGIKAQHQDALLAYQIGDFFEFFDDDARTVARELQIALTGRSYGPTEHVPLAGVPIHAIDTYLTRLVARGYKVAVCEQTSPPGRGLVRREVTRILTPGTVVEPGMLPTARDNYLVAVAFGRRDPTTGQPRSVGLAAVDASTGAFTCVQWSGAALPDALQAELRRLAPAETLAPERLAQPLIPAPITVGAAAGRHAQRGASTATGDNHPESPPPLSSIPLPMGEGNAQAAGQARVGAGLPWLDPFPVTLRPDHDFDAESAYTLLCRQFGAPTLAAFGCEGLPQAIGAAGAILCYLERMNPALLPMLTGLRTYTTDDFVAIDGGAWRALEVVEAAHAPAVGVSHLSHTRSPTGTAVAGGASDVANHPTTLLATLDATRTAMGARLLRRTLTQPLRDRLAIEARLDAVADLHDDGVARERLGATLDGLGDLERLTARVAQGIAVPRELYALAAGLARVPLAREALHSARAAALVGLRDALDPCDEAREFILRAVADPLAGTGRTLQPGYHAELDRLVESVSEARLWIATLEGVERERTGIRSLKVGFNKVFGYYIEVSRPNVPRVPADYQRRQTLSTGERYVTADLKEREALVLSAEEQITALERTLYGEALKELAGYQSRLRTTVAALAQLDVWLGLAEVARVRRLVRPELTDGTELEIVGGRHPIVEATLDGAEFIPNATRLAALGDRDAGARIMLLTGPNMAGKSTYLRQVASITLLAQIGSFVPAASARIGLVDRIFTRVGAEDDLARGLSTFMLEMVETAYILRHATARSLIVLDEVGRGTSVGDGVAIACAVVEYLHDQVGARTLFATHYDELARLAARLPQLRVYRMDVAERDGQAIF